MRLSGSDGTDSTNLLVLARMPGVGFEDGLSRANLVMATSDEVGWEMALVSLLSTSSNLLLVSPKTSTCLTKLFVHCCFDKDHGPPVLLVVSLATFTFSMMVIST